MKRFTILLISFFLYSYHASTQNAETSLTQNQIIDNLVTENNIIGATAAYSINGITKWNHSSGYSDLENKILFTDNTITRMASISKPMTAIAAMQLVEQGLLDLDAPVQKYIVDFPTHKKGAILVKHLLSHTSGIDGYKNGKEAQTTKSYDSLDEAIKVFQNRKLKFKPGSSYSYTTYGYVVLGAIIEKVSGQKFEDYMQGHIWDKVDMYDTGVEKFKKEYENKSLLYHYEKGKSKKASKNNLSNRVPGGGFYTTLNDMIKFGNGVLNNSFIQKSTHEKMLQIYSLEKDGNPYGYGWFLYGPKPFNNAVFGHSGEQTGSACQILIKPESNMVVVVLSNTSARWKNVIMACAEIMNSVPATSSENDN
jgi:CubicO group peptidase (beta-lactamase class C family)